MRQDIYLYYLIFQIFSEADIKVWKSAAAMAHYNAIATIKYT